MSIFQEGADASHADTFYTSLTLSRFFRALFSEGNAVTAELILVTVTSLQRGYPGLPEFLRRIFLSLYGVYRACTTKFLPQLPLPVLQRFFFFRLPPTCTQGTCGISQVFGQLALPVFFCYWQETGTIWFFFVLLDGLLFLWP